MHSGLTNPYATKVTKTWKEDATIMLCLEMCKQRATDKQQM